MLVVRSFIAASCALLLNVSAAEAQTPAANGGARYTPPANPWALPGDVADMSQTGQLGVPLGPKPGKRPSGGRVMPPDMTPSPSSLLAFEAAQRAMDSCAADGYKVAVAVTDAAGHLKAALAPDGAAPNRVFMAMHKDVTAAAFGMTTLELRQKIAADPSLMAQVKPNMVLLPGGVPILKDGHVVGAIAASGATAYEEEKCARDGIVVIQSRL